MSEINNSDAPWKGKALRRSVFIKCISEILEKVAHEPYVPRICLSDNDQQQSIYMLNRQLYELLLNTYKAHERLKVQLAEQRDLEKLDSMDDFWQDIDSPQGAFGG